MDGCRDEVVWSLQFQISLFALSLLSEDGDRGTGQFSASEVAQAEGNMSPGPRDGSVRLVFASTGGASGLMRSDEPFGRTILGLRTVPSSSSDKGPTVSLY